MRSQQGNPDKMAIPKKVYVPGSEETSPALPPRPPLRPNGRRHRSFQFRFRSSSPDESSISTNSDADEEDDLQPIFQDVADALYSNKGTIMETLPDFSKLKGEKGRKTRRRRKPPLLLPKSRNMVLLPQRREERPTRRNGSKNSGIRSSVGHEPEADKTKPQERRFPDQRYEIPQTKPDASTIVDMFSILSVNSDEPITSEWREPSVSVRTEEEIAKGLPMVRRSSYNNAHQRLLPSAIRSTLPSSNKALQIPEINGDVPRRTSTDRKEKERQRQPRRVSRSQSPSRKKRSIATRANMMPRGQTTHLPKSRKISRSIIRDMENLEAIPSFARTASNGSRGARRRPVLFLRSRSRGRSRSMQRVSSHPPPPMTKLPRQPSILKNGGTQHIIKQTPALAQQPASKGAPTANVTLDSVMGQVLAGPNQLLASLVNELHLTECLFNCSNWTGPASQEGNLEHQVGGKAEAGTAKETTSTQESEQDPQKREDCVIEIIESTEREGPEIPSPSSSERKVGRVRSYLSFMGKSKNHLKSMGQVKTSCTTSTAPSSHSSFSPSSQHPSTQELSIPFPLMGNASTDPVPSAPETHAVSKSTPPLYPHNKTTRRSRSGNLQMLSARFRRNTSLS